MLDADFARDQIKLVLRVTSIGSQLQLIEISLSIEEGREEASLRNEKKNEKL